MAINYTNLFEDIGEVIEADAAVKSIYTTLATHLSEIQTEYQGNSMQRLLGGVYTAINSARSNVRSTRNSLRNLVQERLLDKATVRDELALISTSFTSVILAVIADMIANSQTVDASTVTVGSVTEDKANAAAGTLVTTKILDNSSPGVGIEANPSYAGWNSELAFTSETFDVICVADNFQNRTGEGREGFQIVGGEDTGQLGWDTPGSGVGPTIRPLNSQALFSNLEFESFTSDSPDSWTVNTGTVATHIEEETSTVYRGDAALKFLGDASLAAINISQAATISRLKPKRLYCLAGWIRGTAGMSAGTLTIQLEGTGYSAGSSEKIELDNTALAAQTSYGLEHCFILLPAELPSDLKLVVKLTGTPSAHAVYIDGLVFGEVTYHGGIGFALVSGQDPFLVGDTFSVAVTNNDAGTIQAYFRDAFRVQLPSDTGGTETIADTLATD